MNNRLNFASDYTQGAHPDIITALARTNLDFSPGYGTDDFCERARNKIRAACRAENAEVYFLSGGTQTNMVMLDAILRSYEGVISADTGHIAAHEAGAVEFTGHKVLPLPHDLGKLNADTVNGFCECFYADGNYEHMVTPGAVYISQPTEFGTLYSLAELEALRSVCDKYGMRLYLDGARLAYALGYGENDVSLPDIARLCDAFYIGGTKCGALLGEAAVIPQPSPSLRFFTQMKRHGALLAKGRVLGIQFETLFADDLYMRIGAPAVRQAEKIKRILRKSGYTLYIDSPTNQIFMLLTDKEYGRLSEKLIMSFWEKPDDTHTAVRIATSWATTDDDVDRLIHELTVDL
ncbi:MAG: low specificity L-threonine aldolase [Clostridia bacterium]|nr:low specificity L-threonine aldolase [Clostridia bacterium]